MTEYDRSYHDNLVRLDFAVEYLIYAPTQGQNMAHILRQNHVYPNRKNCDFVGIVDQFYIVNTLRMCNDKGLLDSIVESMPENRETWCKYSVVRPLDMCELRTLNEAIRTYPPLKECYRINNDNGCETICYTVNEKINDALRILNENNVSISEHGWYKVRLPH